MNFLQLPWLEAAIAIMLAGALGVSRVRQPFRAHRWGVGLTAAAFLCTCLAWLSFYDDAAAVPPDAGGRIFELDEVNAPLLPAVALLHFLTALATARTKMRRFSFAWSLTAGAIRLATFACAGSWVLIGLLVADTVPPFVELLNRGRSPRVYALHLGLFAGLLIAGWALLPAAGTGPPPAYAVILLTAAVLIRCGLVPAHCWLTDWFEHATFGIALLAVAPLAGVYAAIRLVLPIAPAWILDAIAVAALVTAVYAAAMACVQRDLRRYFAYLFLSHPALVLVGLALHSPVALTGGLCLWFSVILSLGGFGLTARALEARLGRLALTGYHGLYSHSPTLAVCFLLTGLGCVGFPGTIGFIATELLVDGAIDAHIAVGLVVIATTALNGIAVLRVYFVLFTGARHVSTVSLRLGLRERIAVLALTGIILAGGLFPNPGVATRVRAADAILQARPTQP